MLPFHQTISAFERRFSKTKRYTNVICCQVLSSGRLAGGAASYTNVVCCEVKILHSEQNPGPKPGVELTALIDVLSKHRAQCMVVSTTRKKIAASPVRQYLACLPTRVARRVFQSCLSTMTSNTTLKKHFAWDEQAVQNSHALISASILATAQFELSMYATAKDVKACTQLWTQKKGALSS